MFQRFRDLWHRMLGGPKNAGADEDRRIWVRHPSDVQTVVQQAGNGVDTRLSARVRNVSRGGINLVLGKPLKAGDMISIDLPGGTPESASAVLACVVHVHQEGEEEWALGCTFSEELSDDDLTAFGAKRLKPPAPDNRSWVRFVCNVQASCQGVEDATRTTWPARVVNISASGIGLLVDRAIETGTLLSLDLRSLSTQSARTILACVVHVTTRPGSERMLGCNFIHELSEADLKALL
jgi:c-di-GMP-binding flagellar brake protein YcgR